MILMVSNPLHLFFPHPHNNHRAKILHRQSLLILIGLFIVAQSAISLFNQIKPGVLGYASQISPEEVIRLTNIERAKAGLSPVVLNKQLTDAALAKATDMFAKDYWAHNAPDGTEPWYFISRSGYVYLHAGENLARDFSSAQAAVAAWMNSPSHKANLLSSKYKDIGVAVMDGTLNGQDTTLIVQMFGTVQSAAPKTRSESTALNIPEVLAQEPTTAAPVSVPVTAYPTQPIMKISPFDLSRSVSLSFVILLIIVLAFDWLILWRRNIIRISGKTWAHLTYFAAMLTILILLKQGLIL